MNGTVPLFRQYAVMAWTVKTVRLPLPVPQDRSFVFFKIWRNMCKVSAGRTDFLTSVPHCRLRAVFCHVTSNFHVC